MDQFAPRLAGCVATAVIAITICSVIAMRIQRLIDIHLQGIAVARSDQSAELDRLHAQLNKMQMELHHRIRNLLATIQGLANFTARSATDLEEFRLTFPARIAALGQTHTLLLDNDWSRIGLRDLVRAALPLQDDEAPRRVFIIGEDITLPSDIALVLGMAIHELTTNAIKFGALSNAMGIVDLTWSLLLLPENQNRLVLEWRESGGPVVREPTRTGFGSQLMLNIIGRQLKGNVTMDFAPAGLQAVISIPLQTTG